MRHILIDLNRPDYQLACSENLRKGENLSLRLKIIIPPEFDVNKFYLCFQLNDKPVTRTPDIPLVDGALTYDIPKELLTEAGTLSFEVTGYEQINEKTKRVMKSTIITLDIEVSIFEGGI